jgi:hypothetical protein
MLLNMVIKPLRLYFFIPDHTSTVGGVDFWIFDLLQLEFRLAKEFKDQSIKGVFLYLHVSYAEMSFLGPKKLTSH